LYSDSIEFARVAHVLDAAARGDLPSDRRFEGERPPRAYGYGLACIPFDPRSLIECCSRRPWSPESGPVSGIESQIMGEVSHCDPGV